jgi:hypothetical protein
MQQIDDFTDDYLRLTQQSNEAWRDHDSACRKYDSGNADFGIDHVIELEKQAQALEDALMFLLTRRNGGRCTCTGLEAVACRYCRYHSAYIQWKNEQQHNQPA